MGHSDRRTLSLGWQVVLLAVCLYLGDRLADRYGSQFASVLGIEYFFARTTIAVFFGAVVGIVGICAYCGVRRILQRN